MELIAFIFNHSISFCVASIPIVLFFLCLKKHKISHKATAIFLLLVLLVSVYSWLLVKDMSIVVYQSIPYIISFAFLYIDYLIIQKSE